MGTEELRLPDEQPVLRVMPMPSDANVFGDVFGGWIMSHVDVAGGIAAHRRAGGRVATVAVTSFTFKQPVSAGDLVSFYARLLQYGKTSVTVDVEVFAERRSKGFGEVVRVTEAQLVFVALDDEGNKRDIPGE